MRFKLLKPKRTKFPDWILILQCHFEFKRFFLIKIKEPKQNFFPEEKRRRTIIFEKNKHNERKIRKGKLTRIICLWKITRRRYNSFKVAWLSRRNYQKIARRWRRSRVKRVKNLKWRNILWKITRSNRTTKKERWN